MTLFRSGSSKAGLMPSTFASRVACTRAISKTGWVRNLSGYGDVLDASLQHSQGADPVHLGWSVPLGAHGTSIRASYDRGTSSVIEESLRSIDIKSLTSGYELVLGQTLIEKLG